MLNPSENARGRVYLSNDVGGLTGYRGIIFAPGSVTLFRGKLTADPDVAFEQMVTAAMKLDPPVDLWRRGNQITPNFQLR